MEATKAHMLMRSSACWVAHRITLRMGLELRSLAQQYIVREAVLLDLVQQVRPAG